MLTRQGCQARQQRLLRAMEARRWDVFLSGDPRTVYYLSGAVASEEAPAAFVLWGDGASALATTATGEAVADRVLPIETYSIRRAITQPFQETAALLQPLFEARAPLTAAVDRPRTPGVWEQTLGEAAISDASATLLALRKRKEPDEVDQIRESLRYCAAAYRAARATIAPGLTEIDVYNAMHAAVTREAGTEIAFPGDFACGERAIGGGGPPTRRVLQPGDLYILDLFPAPHFYFGDVCRTFAVTSPNDVQLRAWEGVCAAMREAEAAIRPGIAAREVYALVKSRLDALPEAEASFWHHAGHGIGLRGQESPRIIPGADDVFEIDDVFTLEPGIYSKALGGGMRLENNYILRENGLEKLFDFPLGL